MAVVPMAPSRSVITLTILVISSRSLVSVLIATILLVPSMPPVAMPIAVLPVIVSAMSPVSVLAVLAIVAVVSVAPVPVLVLAMLFTLPLGLLRGQSLFEFVEAVHFVGVRRVVGELCLLVFGDELRQGSKLDKKPRWRAVAGGAN